MNSKHQEGLRLLVLSPQELFELQEAECLLPSLCLWLNSAGREGFEVVSKTRLWLMVTSWNSKSETKYRDIR